MLWVTARSTIEIGASIREDRVLLAGLCQTSDRRIQNSLRVRQPPGSTPPGYRNPSRPVLNRVAPRQWPVRLAGWAVRRLNLSYRPGAWFAFDPRVDVRTVPGLQARFVPDAEVVVATAWTTAEWVRQYPPSKGSKVYWVQDYEHLMTAPPAQRERMQRTYRGPFRLVVISPALRDFLDQQGISSQWIPNAIDDNVFAQDIAITSIERQLIGFPYRSEPYKGTEDVLGALARLIVPLQLAGRVWCFGSPPRPKQLPRWVNYHQRPSDGELCQLYNQTRIFVVGSHYEGWGLPGMEAMACGRHLGFHR